MGDQVVLNFQFRGEVVDVVVDDVDKVMLIDLIIDYWDNAVKKKIEIPKFPSFRYVYQNNYFYLNTDNDLMNMFSNFADKKEINIWVGEFENATDILKSAKVLRTSRNAKEFESIMSGVAETLGITGEGGNINERHDDATVDGVEQVCTNKITQTARPPKLTPRRSNQMEKEAVVISGAEFYGGEGPTNNVEIDYDAEDRVNNFNDETWAMQNAFPEKGRDEVRTRGGVRGSARGRGTVRVRGKGSGNGIVSDRGRGFRYWLGLENQSYQPKPHPAKENEPEQFTRVIRSTPRRGRPTVVIEPIDNTPPMIQIESAQPIHETQSEHISSQPQLLPTPSILDPNLNFIRLSSLSSNASGLYEKKVPRTTAKRKGTFLSSSSASQQLSDSVRVGRSRSLDMISANDEDMTVLIDEDDDDDDDPEFDADDTESDEDSDDVSVLDEDGPEFDNDHYDLMVNDYYDPYADELRETEDLDDESYFSKLYRNGIMYQDEEYGKIQLKPWQLFTDKDHLRDVVRDYCIQCGFSVVVDRASNSRYTVSCSTVGCDWRLHASKLPYGFTWAIKSIKNMEHACTGLEERNSMVSTKWASRVLLEDIRANNDISAKALNLLLWNRYTVRMATSTLYRMRSKALIEIHGGHDISYSYLPAYCEMIKSTNPGSDASCVWTPTTHIERPLSFVTIFISIKGALEGLNRGVRSFFGVDGTHLKGNYGGVLLSAVALDANNELFPFAWGVVSNENADIWCFFVHHLKNLLFSCDREEQWCIISDRQKGIEAALDEIWPECGRRYCVKHLAANFKKAFPGPLTLSLFNKAVGAYSPFTFRKAMEQIDKTKKGARLWLAKLGDQCRWTKHKFSPHVKSDVNKSNFVESFNATLGIDRCRPVLTLLEGTRRNTMVRMATRRSVCEGWARNDICPNIVRRVQISCTDSRTCHAYLCNEEEGEYEVLDGKSYLSVSLKKHTCLCGQWQLSGIPCKHGMRAILFAKLDPHAFVHEWYSVQRYKASYSCGIKSLPDHEQWPQMENTPKIQPPELKRGIGRPCRNRKRADDEERKGKRAKTVTCSKCDAFGHNARTCKGGLTAKQNKGKGEQKKTQKSQVQQMKQASTSSPFKVPRQKIRLSASQPTSTSRQAAVVFASQAK